MLFLSYKNNPGFTHFFNDIAVDKLSQKELYYLFPSRALPAFVVAECFWHTRLVTLLPFFNLSGNRMLWMWPEPIHDCPVAV